MKLVSRSRFRTAGYVLLLAACLVVAVVTGWTALGDEIDNDAYDFLFRLNLPKPWPLDSVLLAADEESLKNYGSMRRIRTMLADVLDRLSAAHPKVVAIDVLLPDASDDPEDTHLEAAFRKTKNLVLSCAQTRDGWEYPIPRFRQWAAAVGHVHTNKDPLDSVSRSLPIEEIAFHDRRWALSLEAFRLATGGGPILESPWDLQVGGVVVPARRRHDIRSMLIRYLPPLPDGNSPIPTVTFAQMLGSAPPLEKLRNKVVFVGIMAESAAWDRLMTPYSFGRTMPGVEVHAHAFETLHSGRFLRPAPETTAVLFSLLLVVASGLIFHLLSGWPAYLAGIGVLLVAHLTPYFLFRRGIVFPYMGALAAAWLSAVAAATYQHFIVRRNLQRSETERGRYRQAIHFVTHEMRTPLTAIQGSSELMSRYNLNDEKRKQMAGMINSESKRLAHMVQTFLDVERLGEGQLELRQEDYSVRDCLNTCIERARVIAERKQIEIVLEESPDCHLHGDRELMEYAFYNLLTNAVKYSPVETCVHVGVRTTGSGVRVSVADQGIGMDDAELKNIFVKFYRTRKAEASGEAGTGIGLSIVEQIVARHGGRIEVTSQPAKGSCFTVNLPFSRTAV